MTYLLCTLHAYLQSIYYVPSCLSWSRDQNQSLQPFCQFCPCALAAPPSPRRSPRQLTSSSLGVQDASRAIDRRFKHSTQTHLRVPPALEVVCHALSTALVARQLLAKRRLHDAPDMIRPAFVEFGRNVLVGPPFATDSGLIVIAKGDGRGARAAFSFDPHVVGYVLCQDVTILS
jgi:hypothetical protein